MKLETSVGSPLAGLTYYPSLHSLAAYAAIWCLIDAIRFPPARRRLTCRSGWDAARWVCGLLRAGPGAWLNDFTSGGEELLGEQLVHADIGRVRLADLPSVQQPAQHDAVEAGIVGDDGEVLDPGIADRIRQGLGHAAETKTAGHDHHAVF